MPRAMEEATVNAASPSSIERSVQDTPPCCRNAFPWECLQVTPGTPKNMTRRYAPWVNTSTPFCLCFGRARTRSLLCSRVITSKTKNQSRKSWAYNSVLVHNM